MKVRREIYVALLRGINLGQHCKVPMAALRSVCAETGCGDVQSYIQSGNLVFTATATSSALEDRLEAAVERHFGFAVPIIVRSGTDWKRYFKSNPFPDASRQTPNFVVLALSKNPPKAGAVEGLLERATKGEEVVKTGGVLWIHYRGGIGRSKLSPAILDRLVGSPVTCRNWRTVVELHEMVKRTRPTD